MATNLKQVKRGYANLKRSGTQMYYETMGSGDPVIFVHQCWWNNFEFEGVIPMVAKQYTVYSPDSLGFGFSPAAPNWFEFTDFTDSFIDFMDDLGIEKASFVGQHSGSLIMADLAARYPERVDKLIFGGLAIYEDSLRKAKAARRDMIGGNKMPLPRACVPATSSASNPACSSARKTAPTLWSTGTSSTARTRTASSSTSSARL